MAIQASKKQAEFHHGWWQAQYYDAAATWLSKRTKPIRRSTAMTNGRSYFKRAAATAWAQVQTGSLLKGIK